MCANYIAKPISAILIFGKLLAHHGHGFVEAGIFHRVAAQRIGQQLGCGGEGASFGRFRVLAAQLGAIKAGIENVESTDHWLLVNMLFEEKGETAIDPSRPTFVTHFPSAISPLSRPDPEAPDLALRGELFIAGMELSNSYTELNDPDVQNIMAGMRSAKAVMSTPMTAPSTALPATPARIIRIGDDPAPGRHDTT